MKVPQKSLYTYTGKSDNGMATEKLFKTKNYTLVCLSKFMTSYCHGIAGLRGYRHRENATNARSKAMLQKCD